MKLISGVSVQWIGTFLVICVPWALLVLHVSRFWSADAQYGYGWVVPFMAAFFFWEKWKTLPTGSQTGKLLPLMGSCIATIPLALTWLAHEAVPDWSVVNWSFALSAVLYLLSMIAFWRGRAAAFQLLFPVLFILCAVPWPQRLEFALVEGLMKMVAGATADLVARFGVPALAAGNIIWLPAGMVGIDEACSGVRSLQATLMVSLFLGELLRMRILARLFLICIGLVLALFCNVGRTVTLVCIAHAQGFAAMEKWHDPAGFSVSSISLLLLYFFARPLGRPAAPDTGNSTGRLEPLPMPLILGFSGWFLFFIVGSEIWYRRHETKLSGIRHLSIVWPSDVAGISKISIPDSARRILLYDDAQCASWLDRNGLRWTFYSLIWNSGRTSTQSARVHRPENCLQGSGAILHKEMQPTIVQVGGIPLAFRTYLFDWNETTLHVFYLIWEDGNRDLDPTALGQDWSGISRLQRVWLGQRNLGQQTLEVVLSGATSDEEARTTFQAELEKIVRIRSGW
jgi:exosortase